MVLTLRRWNPSRPHRLRAWSLVLAFLLGLPAFADELEGVVRMSRADYDRLKDARSAASFSRS